MSNKILRFSDTGAGFSLFDPAFKGDLLALEDYEIGDQALHDEKGEVVGFSETFMEKGLEPLSYYIQEARRLNIPGRYDVPELGLKDATFVEVLEAVRDYYVRKLVSRSEDFTKVSVVA